LYIFKKAVHTISNPQREAAKAQRFLWKTKEKVEILILPFYASRYRIYAGLGAFYMPW